MVEAIAHDVHAVQVLTIHPDGRPEKAAVLAAITAAAHEHQTRLITFYWMCEVAGECSRRLTRPTGVTSRRALDHHPGTPIPSPKVWNRPQSGSHRRGAQGYG